MRIPVDIDISISGFSLGTSFLFVVIESFDEYI